MEAVHTPGTVCITGSDYTPRAQCRTQRSHTSTHTHTYTHTFSWLDTKEEHLWNQSMGLITNQQGPGQSGHPSMTLIHTRKGEEGCAKLFS